MPFYSIDLKNVLRSKYLVPSKKGTKGKESVYQSKSIFTFIQPFYSLGFQIFTPLYIIHIILTKYYIQLNFHEKNIYTFYHERYMLSIMHKTINNSISAYFKFQICNLFLLWELIADSLSFF